MLTIQDFKELKTKEGFVNLLKKNNLKSNLRTYLTRLLTKKS